MKRFASLVSLLVISVSILLLTGEASAQEEGAMLMLRPYCETGYENDTWIYGPSVPPTWTPDEDTEICSPFEVQDPQTLKTPALHIGDTLDLDLVIQNPGEINISSVSESSVASAHTPA